MNKAVHQTLGSVISIAKGKKHEITETPSQKAKRLIGIDDLRNDDLIRCTDDASGTEVVPEDVLIAWDGANAGTIGFGKAGYIGSTIARLRVKTDTRLFTPFLGLYLKSRFDYLRQTTTGATIPHISRSALENIPLPPIAFDDQIRIAYLLGKVEGLIAQRKRHLQQLDDLLKSVFLEMFGDPVRNEKGWEKKPFSKLLGNIESGKSPKCEARPATTDEWGVLKLGAVTSCFYKEEENKALPENVQPLIRDEVKAGDLLFSRKNTYELVAACAYVFSTRSKLLMPDLIFRFVFRDDAEVNPIYIWKLLTAQSQRKAIQSLASGAAGSMPNISKANLREVLLPIPPLSLQNDFAAIVEKVESIKTYYQQSLTDLEALYGALGQQAFQGELDLSRIKIPQSLPPEAKSQDPVPPILDRASQRIELPELPIELTLFGKGREAALQYWFEAALKGMPTNSTFQAEKLIDAINFRLIVMDDQDREFDGADYDVLKRWVFDALANGKLTQTCDDAGNRIQLKASLA